MDMNEEIGRRIREARERKNISQEKLAELAETSLTSISRLERGKTMVSLKKLNKIADALDTNLAELLQDVLGGDSVESDILDRIRLLLAKCTVEERKYWIENLQLFVDLQRSQKMKEQDEN